MGRAVSVHQLYKTKFDTIPITGDFKKLIGAPELKGSWIIWGDSSNGKTSFALQLAKELTKHRRVAYNSMEEGVSLTMATAFKRVGMEAVKKRIVLLDNEPLEELKERLRRRRSPDIIIMDSLQYVGIDYDGYKELKEEFLDKLFIWISHADGKKPKGSVAEAVRYDAPVKIRVEGYKAFATSRFATEDTVPYTIWQQGADQYEGKIF